MRKIIADYIFPISSEPVQAGVVVVDDTGKILSVDGRAAHDPATVEVHRGIIVPGFVNAHCHLELSHLKGVAPTGTGLLPFLKTVVSQRDVPQEQIDAAIELADRQMYEAGIVAVGDISNKADTAEVKRRSPLRYYTFVEMFDFLQDERAQETFDKYYEVFQQHPGNGKDRKSCVPHAPYTVSKKLFQLINEANQFGTHSSFLTPHPSLLTVSIHNQETAHEDDFFRSKTGGFLDFYTSFGIPVSALEASGQPSIYYALKNMDTHHRILFVHNTQTQPAEIQAANCQLSTANCYWATCPNANLYIENRLPNYRYFLDNQAKMCIGTDSLTSNWQLSVLEEMKTIARYQSYVDTATLLRWATLNGAEALGFDDTLGSIEPGKTPGLNLLNLDADLKLTSATCVKKLL